MRVKIATLPVYRITRDEYNSQRDQSTENSVKMAFGGPNNEIKKIYSYRNTDWLSAYKESLNKKYGGCWEFNEIIGFIDVYVDEDKVIGDYWQDDKKRLVKSRNRQFVYLTSKVAPTIHFNPTNNDEIYKSILAYVDGCKRELKGRYIETDCLINTGKHINWKALISAKSTGLR